LKLRRWTLTSGHIDGLKNSIKQYGELDVKLFGNSLVLTTDPDKSSLKQYVKGEMKIEKELSDILGKQVWSGIWL